MHTKIKNKHIFMPLVLAVSITGFSTLVKAEITLYDQDGTTFSTDGYINAFYVNSDIKRTDVQGNKLDRRQARIKMGFLPNYLGFNMTKQMGDLKLGARASFWVTINDSDENGTGTDIDVRQFYGTVSSDWGEVLIGKDFGLFARSNILLDQMLAGYGQVSDTLGLVDGGGVSFGNIGSGYPYPFPTSQITYRSPVMGGVRVAAGLMDPVDTTDSNGALGKAYQKNPRFESELTYEFNIAGAEIYSWLNGSYQTSDNTDHNIKSVTSKGLGYGVQAKMGSFLIAGSGFNAKGLNPFFTNNLGKATLRDIDSRGYLVQGSYIFGKNRIALSYGKTKDDGNGVVATGADYNTRAIAYFRDVNDHLKLVAEYNQFKINGHKTNATNEKTNTFAVGAVVTW